MEQVNLYVEKAGELLITYGLKLLGAVVALLIGLWIIKILVRSVRKGLDKGKMDESLKPFLTSMITIMLKTLLFISVLGMMGIQMTSFIAVIGAAGLAVGMALSGTLQNFAGGVMILLFKPFKVGDFISSQGYSGSVKAIQIFNTILNTDDKQTIIIPNGGLATGSMVNFSTEPQRRVDWSFSIGYGDDVDKARSAMMNLIYEDSRISKDPEPFIAVSELGDSSVKLTVRVWVNSSDYWGVFFDMNEKVYKTFSQRKP